MSTSMNVLPSPCPVTLISGLDPRLRETWLARYVETLPSPVGVVDADGEAWLGDRVHVTASRSDTCCPQPTTTVDGHGCCPQPAMMVDTLIDTVSSLVKAGAFSIIVEIHAMSSPLRSSQALIQSLNDMVQLVEMVTVVSSSDVTRVREKVASEEGGERVRRFVEQLEAATVIVLDGDNNVSAEAWVRALNSRARWVSDGDLPELGAAMGLEDLGRRAGWLMALMEASVDGRWRVFRAWRPFHPVRLHTWLSAGGLRGVARSAGFCWLATSMQRVCRWSQAGRYVWLNPAGRWWATRLEPGQYAAPPELPEALGTHWREPFGDRRQALALWINDDCVAERVRNELDACLLTGEEMALGSLGWRFLPDPLPHLRWFGDAQGAL